MNVAGTEADSVERRLAKRLPSLSIVNYLELGHQQIFHQYIYKK